MVTSGFLVQAAVAESVVRGVAQLGLELVARTEELRRLLKAAGAESVLPDESRLHDADDLLVGAEADAVPFEESADLGRGLGGARQGDERAERLEALVFLPLREVRDAVLAGHEDELGAGVLRGKFGDGVDRVGDSAAADLAVVHDGLRDVREDRLQELEVPELRDAVVGLEGADVRRNDDQAVESELGDRAPREADVSEMRGIERSAVDTDFHRPQLYQIAPDQRKLCSWFGKLLRCFSGFDRFVRLAGFVALIVQNRFCPRRNERIWANRSLVASGESKPSNFPTSNFPTRNPIRMISRIRRIRSLDRSEQGFPRQNGRPVPRKVPRGFLERNQRYPPVATNEPGPTLLRRLRRIQTFQLPNVQLSNSD